MPSIAELHDVGIVGTGSYAPARVVTNEELARLVPTDPQWVFDKLGIRERRIAADGETTSDLAVMAARAALESASLQPGDIDLLIVATATPDRPSPSTATIVQRKLGSWGYPAFDIAAVCSGFVHGVVIATQFVATGSCRRALVVGADMFSRITDWTSRECVYFGDGAGAVVLSRCEPGYGVTATDLGADGRSWECFTVPAGGSERPASTATLENREHFYRQNGPAVYEFAVSTIPGAINRVLARAGVTADEIDLVVPHQAGVHALHEVARRSGIPVAKFVTVMDRFGNTAGASVPMALDDAVRTGRVGSGDRVLLVGFGAGMTWGSALLRWSKGCACG